MFSLFFAALLLLAACGSDGANAHLSATDLAALRKGAHAKQLDSLSDKEIRGLADALCDPDRKKGGSFKDVMKTAGIDDPPPVLIAASSDVMSKGCPKALTTTTTAAPTTTTKK
jgi:hypothetical protein